LESSIDAAAALNMNAKRKEKDVCERVSRRKKSIKSESHKQCPKEDLFHVSKKYRNVVEREIEREREKKVITLRI
jgi:hypothetical protein